MDGYGLTKLLEGVLHPAHLAPLRVCRLAYRAAIVYALAALQFLPGPQRKLIQRTWPRLVQHLATTLEQNHMDVRQAGNEEYRQLACAGSSRDAPRWLPRPRRRLHLQGRWRRRQRKCRHPPSTAHRCVRD